MKHRIPVPPHAFPLAGGTYAAAEDGTLTQTEAPALAAGATVMADRLRDAKRALTPKAGTEEEPAPAEEPAAEDKPRKPRKS